MRLRLDVVLAFISIVLGGPDGGVGNEAILRQPGMNDDKFAADAEWVRRDLQALKAMFTK